MICNLPCIEALIEAQADITIQNESNQSAINFAALKGCEKCCKALFDEGAGVTNLVAQLLEDGISDEEKVALIRAVVRYEDLDYMEMIIDAGAQMLVDAVRVIDRALIIAVEERKNGRHAVSHR